MSGSDESLDGKKYYLYQVCPFGQTKIVLPLPAVCELDGLTPQTGQLTLLSQEQMATATPTSSRFWMIRFMSDC
jgi:hypothetical protein